MIEAVSRPAGLLRRERVQRRITASTRRPVTLIVAPAGSGKTVALQHYLETLGTAYVRFDARTEHATLLGFARGFSTALAEIAPHAPLASADAVRGAYASTNPVSTLAQWLSEHLHGFAGTVAIDDVHLLDQDAEVAAVLAALIDATKSHANWIISARSIVNLPVSSWVVYDLAEIPIGEADLRFTPSEAFDAAAALESPLDRGDVTHLHAVTSGWATALTLALRASHYEPDMGRAALKAREISYQYLADHVYRALEPAEQEILLTAALMPEIDADVLVHAGFHDARALLSGIAERMTFLRVHPDEGAAASPRRYRCHDLFHDFLMHQVELHGEAWLRDASTTAADALVRAHQPAAALRLYARVCAKVQMIAVLKEHGFNLLREGHSDLVDATLEQLSQGDDARDFVVLGLRGIRASEEAEYATAEALLREAIDLCDDAAYRARLVLRLGFAMLNGGKSPIDLLEHAARDGDVPFAARTELLALLAAAHASAERFDELAPLLDEVEAMAAKVEAEGTRATILHCLGTAAFISGDAPRTKRLLVPAAELAVRHRMFKLASMIYGNLSSNALHNDDDCVQALAFARLNRELASKCPEAQFRLQGSLEELRIRTQLGDVAQLREIIDACAVMGDAHSKFASVVIWDARATLAACEGNFAEAISMQMRASDLHHFESERTRSETLHALFLAIEGSRQEALDALEQSAARNACVYDKTIPRSRALVLARLLRGLAYALCGRPAFGSRVATLDAAGSDATLRTTAMLVAILIADIEKGVLDDAFETHLETLRGRGYGALSRIFSLTAQRLHQQRPSEGLTPAELGVLRALARGETPKEIAAKSASSIHTVRWHIRMAIKKFSCSGRDQALRIARDRGLL